VEKDSRDAKLVRADGHRDLRDVEKEEDSRVGRKWNVALA